MGDFTGLTVDLDGGCDDVHRLDSGRREQLKLHLGGRPHVQLDPGLRRALHGERRDLDVVTAGRQHAEAEVALRVGEDGALESGVGAGHDHQSGWNSGSGRIFHYAAHGSGAILRVEERRPRG